MALRILQKKFVTEIFFFNPISPFGFVIDLLKRFFHFCEIFSVMRFEKDLFFLKKILNNQNFFSLICKGENPSGSPQGLMKVEDL